MFYLDSSAIRAAESCHQLVQSYVAVHVSVPRAVATGSINLLCEPASSLIKRLTGSGRYRSRYWHEAADWSL